MGIGGITLSTSLVTLFNACVLGLLIKRKMSMDYRALFINLFKMLLAGVITFVICMAAAFAYDRYIELPQLIFEIIKIVLIFVICIGVYTPLNLIMKMDYASELASRLKAKFGKGQ